MILQSSTDIETLIKADMRKSIATEIDRVILEGSSSGSSKEPTGILMTGGIGSVSMGAVPTYSKLIEMIVNVQANNAMSGSPAFFITPEIMGKLMQTFCNATYGEQALYVAGDQYNTGKLCNYPCYVTSNMPSDWTSDNDHTLLFGNFSDCILGLFSGVDLMVDPYTYSSSGTVRVVTMVDLDVCVRHAESFCACLDAHIS